ncbi:MAG: ABC transporter ATP-binding protein [Solirubrobacterales bacterium]|nr:ABC transporter ATP-binding protein [Solirubrobacterales bacterium]
MSISRTHHRDASPDKAVDADPAIEIVGLSQSFGDTQVLHGIDLTVGAGEVFGFLGHNGSGKTTTINVLTTLIKPTVGVARVCGFDVLSSRLDVQRSIGYLPENIRLYDDLTASENLCFFAKLSGVKDVSGAIDQALGFLDCTELADRRVGTFSKGMRQRIGIAQAILHQPAVLFLDEPTSGLDPMGVRQLRETISRLNSEMGMTIFMNTHLLSEVSRVCTTIGVLAEGSLIYLDSMDRTLERFPDEASLEDIYVRLDYR